MIRCTLGRRGPFRSIFQRISPFLLAVLVGLIALVVFIHKVLFLPNLMYCLSVLTHGSKLSGLCILVYPSMLL